MTIISTKELDIYLERSSPREHGQIFYIGGTGGDLRNRPNQLDSPLTEFFETNPLIYSLKKESLNKHPANNPLTGSFKLFL